MGRIRSHRTVSSTSASCCHAEWREILSQQYASKVRERSMHQGKGWCELPAAYRVRCCLRFAADVANEPEIVHPRNRITKDGRSTAGPQIVLRASTRAGPLTRALARAEAQTARDRSYEIKRLSTGGVKHISQHKIPENSA
jgi:hypothetical protein